MDYQLTKRPKTENIVESQHEIYNLNDDCLGEVFMLLNHEDLLNVADTSKRFSDLAKSVYKRKYIDRSVVIIHPSKWYNNRCEDPIFMSKLHVALKLLRNFGEVIQKLSVTFDNKTMNVERLGVLENYIMKYCSQKDSLKELRLRNCRKKAFDNIEQPFESLEVFIFENGHLGISISDFNRWFPKIRHLELSQVKTANKSFLNQNIPHLHHLDFDSTCDMEAAISMNPKLQSIKLSKFTTRHDLRSINCKLPEIQTLKFRIDPEDYEEGDKLIRFQNIKKLWIDICDENNPFYGLPVVCDALEDLAVRCHFFYLSHVKFANSNNLKRFCLFVNYDPPKRKEIEDTLKHWPNLEDISIHIDYFSVDELVDLMKKYKNLKKLGVMDSKGDCEKKLNEVIFKLNNEWKLIEVDYDEIEIVYCLVKIEK